MGVGGTRIAVVGGSIAGCAAAVGLRRAGCDVTVYERSRGTLQDRGAGIGLPVPLRDELVSAGYLDGSMPSCWASERLWMARDGEARTGRLLWRQPITVALNNWGVLWRTLRAQVPDERYREGAVITGLESDGDGATVTLRDGRPERFDVIVGADGYRSTVRGLVDRAARPAYAGYFAWRGNVDEARLPGLGPLESNDTFVTVCFPGGHGLFFLMPGFDGRTDPGHRRVNWVIYSSAQTGTGFEDATSLPPGSVTEGLATVLDDLIGEKFPPYWADVVRLTEARLRSVQPIYDVAAATYVAGRVVLIGDAGTVTRPHTASGATKALQDALALERACTAHDLWDDALAAYDGQRCPAGNQLVELGRRIGHAQVEATPDWTSMTGDDFEAWTHAILAGQRLYFYANVPGRHN
jgi:2-polyprenyl-6-methoxyphenol hydroxylase-like FAD-dependent oxidoreductase